MKKYADNSENFIYQKYETLKDVLKYNFTKALLFEKSLKDTEKE